MSIENPYIYDIFTLYTNDNLVIIKESNPSEVVYKYNLNDNKITYQQPVDSNVPYEIDKVATPLIKEEDINKAIIENVEKMRTEKDIVINNLNYQLEYYKLMVNDKSILSGDFELQFNDIEQHTAVGFEIEII